MFVDGDVAFLPIKFNKECYIPLQWRIQDFPLGGRRPVGGAPTSDVYTFRQKHMRKQKKLILLGGARASSIPPGSANALARFP